MARTRWAILGAGLLGLAVPATELQTTDPDTIDRILRLAEIHSQGGRMAVEIEGGEIRAIDVTVGTSLRQ